MLRHFLLSTALTLPALAQQNAETDVIVYSGVPCGIASAISAAREGAKVILIEPEKHVGGLSTSGINTAEAEHMLEWTIGGFADEFYRRMGKHYGSEKPAYKFESSVAQATYEAMLEEAGVTIRYGNPVAKVEKNGPEIRSITLTDGSVLSAKVFIDASYEGDLMARAGVKYAVGRESKAEFGEEAAGIRFDRTVRQAPTVDAEGKLLPGISGWAKDYKEGDAHPGVMNYNFRFTVTKDAAMGVPIPQPDHYDARRYAILAGWLRAQAAAEKPVKLGDILAFLKRGNGKFELNNVQAAVFSLGHFGGQFGWPDADYPERKKIFRDHMDYSLGLIHFLATDEAVPENMRKEMRATYLHKGEYQDNANLPYQLYVREGRRMRGAYVMTQKDVQESRRKDDSIGMSSHFIDSHHVQRLALSPTEFVNEGRIWRLGYAYQIPYRALLPEASQATNLLVPGAASYTHVAFCTLRLESVWMITGQAAGVAAATAVKDSLEVRNVPLAPLQEKLRAAKQVVDFIPGAPEKAEKLNGPPEF